HRIDGKPRSIERRGECAPLLPRAVAPRGLRPEGPGRRATSQPPRSSARAILNGTVAVPRYGRRSNKKGTGGSFEQGDERSPWTVGRHGGCRPRAGHDVVREQEAGGVGWWGWYGRHDRHRQHLRRRNGAGQFPGQDAVLLDD